MPVAQSLLEKLNTYGVGRRNIDDKLFEKDKFSSEVGIFDVDDEALCHEIVYSTCSVPGCQFTAESILEFENHYNSSHRYTCSQCKKCLLSPHLLDLHLQETHDSFFAVMAERKPSYSCYIEECKEKFMNASQRAEHCVKEHKLPKHFKYAHRFRSAKAETGPKNTGKMDIDENLDNQKKTDKINLSNGKQKTFRYYTAKKFIKDRKYNSCMDMEEIIGDLRDSLPE